jgi:hypothetical protein
MREVSGQIRESCLRDVRPYARQSRLVCFAQAQLRPTRSTCAGRESRLQVYSAPVWRHGVVVYVQDCRRTWAHATTQPHPCRVTTRRCLRGRLIMACQQRCRRTPSALMRFANLPSLRRPGRCLPLRYPRPAVTQAFGDPAIDCGLPLYDSSMSATAALSTHHMPLSDFLSEQSIESRSFLLL